MSPPSIARRAKVCVPSALSDVTKLPLELPSPASDLSSVGTLPPPVTLHQCPTLNSIATPLHDHLETLLARRQDSEPSRPHPLPRQAGPAKRRCPTPAAWWPAWSLRRGPRRRRPPARRWHRHGAWRRGYSRCRDSGCAPRARRRQRAAGTPGPPSGLPRARRQGPVRDRPGLARNSESKATRPPPGLGPRRP